jgi:hypothetical protein
MAIVFNGTTKIISLPIGSPEISVKEIYSRWVDWVALSDNSKFQQAMRYVGGDPLPGSKELGITYFLLNGWKIRPAEENYTLTINGNLYSEDGSSPYTSVLGSYQVMVINSVSNLVDSTVQQLPEIEHASYEGGVTIDTVNGTDSSEYPYGTPAHPCKTTTNSYLIRTSRGFNKIYLKSDLLLTGIPDGILDGLTLVGVGGIRAHTITVDNVLMTNCKSENIISTGTCKTGSHVRLVNCEVDNVTNCSMEAVDCFIQSGEYYMTELTNCHVTGDLKVQAGGYLSGIGIVFEGDENTIDMQGTATTVSLDISSGYVEILNSTTGSLAEFNLSGGELELNENCTGGKLYVEGHGILYNNGTMDEVINNLMSTYMPDATWSYER